jgi:hypothetical protein
MIGVALVCGGRGYADRARVWSVLDKLAARVELSAVRHGGARGADSLAGEWARARGVPEQVYPADWSRGKTAGFERNAAMLADNDPNLPYRHVVCAVAFPGGRGTADMVRRLRAANVPTWEP